ncbi:chromosome partitioning protein ParB [Leucobacter sp. UCD-THU]|nr:chromosome partitioning protein ParB [Leucobacter sp. UCD-THU]
MEGMVEVERAVDSIRVADRLRQDLGDLTELCDSISELGLLQPVTITPDGDLICGWRRLEACRRLGKRRIRVWVRSGLSTELQRALAQQHENAVRKSYSPIEAARIYEELKKLYQEEAQRNMAVTRFGASPGLPTVGTPVGNAGKRAALAVTGSRSDLTLERVLEVQRLSEDPAIPETLRNIAREQLEVIESERTVTGPYAQVKAAEAEHLLEAVIAEPELPTSLREETARALSRLAAAENNHERIARARDALRHAKAARSRPAKPPKDVTLRAAPAEPRRYSPRALAMMLHETDYWWLHYDPSEVGAAFTDEQWQLFEEWIAQTTAFYETVREARVR